MSEVRLIDANALKYKNLAEVNGRLTYVLTAEEIDNAPTVCGNTPKWCESCVSKGKCASTRPQGEWNEWTDERWGGTMIYCPYCKETALKEYRDGLYRWVKSNFCPNCGADMRGGAE